MDRDVPGPMTPFDELVTTPELQMIKLLIPYAPASGRQTLAALVKYTELRKAVRLFHSGGRCPGSGHLKNLLRTRRPICWNRCGPISPRSRLPSWI